jgi:hypothetical protein
MARRDRASTLPDAFGTMFAELIPLRPLLCDLQEGKCADGKLSVYIYHGPGKQGMNRKSAFTLLFFLSFDVLLGSSYALGMLAVPRAPGVRRCPHYVRNPRHRVPEAGEEEEEEASPARRRDRVGIGSRRRKTTSESASFILLASFTLAS